MRYVITFNGEIYNYEALARELRGLGHKFTGRSDTEVMLAAFEQWGVDSAVERFNGMFAFSLWDRQERYLYLARDRMGEKPLYYGWNSGSFLFASELKAFMANPRFTASINPSAAALALQYSYIPAPWSIYHDIYKLIPGTILKLSLDEMFKKPSAFSPVGKVAATGQHPHYFWTPSGLITPEHARSFTGTERDALSHLEALLTDAVNIRMVSDVPVGAFLSGGIDSSLIVALMQKRSTQPIKTFSIGFHDAEYNEAVHAKRVAQHLGTEHLELYLSPKEIIDVIPTLPSMYDEPFGDSSQIPTYLVSKLCRESVTVSLSGDGGDELFAGYSRYAWALKYWARAGRYPYPLRRLTSDLLASALSKNTSQTIARFLPLSLRNTAYLQKLGTASRLLRFKDRRALYDGLMSHWANETAVTPNTSHLSTLFNTYPTIKAQSFLDEMTAIDIQSYLPDDILVKLDRASMAVSLEARTPFLDHRIVEFALSLPESFKLKTGEGKSILRQILRRYVPDSLTNRPKMGFSIPLGKWLRSDLRSWAEDLLSEHSLSLGGHLNPAPIRKRWREHLAGTHNWEHHLWDILMFQSWLRENCGRQATG
jgi:asparagine synthase (glutamine-hydrolysing)